MKESRLGWGINCRHHGVNSSVKDEIYSKWVTKYLETSGITCKRTEAAIVFWPFVGLLPLIRKIAWGLCNPEKAGDCDAIDTRRLLVLSYLGRIESTTRYLGEIALLSSRSNLKLPPAKNNRLESTLYLI